MLSRIGTVVVVAWLAVGCAPGDDAFDRPDTLATVADDPVTTDQVEPLVEDSAVPLVHVAGERAPSPWRDALDLAVRDELLAREAARRGIEAPTRAEQIAALVAEERRDHHLGPEAVDDEQARAWYLENRALFDTVARAEVSWARIADEAVARTLLDRAAAGDAEEFARLIGEPAEVVDSGAATIDDHGDGADPMVARAAFAVRANGGVGLAPDPENDRWWLVRVESISFEPEPWDTAHAERVKLALATQLEEDHLERLAASLRERWPVRVNETHLANVSGMEGSR